MRKIKYRGKRISDGEWQIGDLVTEAFKERVDRAFIHLRLSPVLFSGDSLTSNLVLHEVDPETVGECTGLHDKNRKEIYEGDIIHIPYNRLGTIIVRMVDGTYNISRYRWELCEIIGNIYDNPELIEEGEPA